MAEPGAGINAEGTTPPVALPVAESPKPQPAESAVDQKPQQLTREQKEQRWQESENGIKQQAKEDGGNEVPEDMLEMLVAFDVTGFNVRALHDGTTEIGGGTPHVTLGAKGIEALNNEVGKAHQDAWKSQFEHQGKPNDETDNLFKEYHNKRKQLELKNMEATSRVKGYMYKFNSLRRSRPQESKGVLSDDDRSLILISSPVGYGDAQIECQGAFELRKITDPVTREHMRKEYAAEVQEFARFLKNDFLGIPQQEQSQGSDTASQPEQAMPVQEQPKAPEPTPITINRPPQAPPKAHSLTR